MISIHPSDLKVGDLLQWTPCEVQDPVLDAKFSSKTFSSTRSAYVQNRTVYPDREGRQFLALTVDLYRETANLSVNRREDGSKVVEDMSMGFFKESLPAFYLDIPERIVKIERLRST